MKIIQAVSVLTLLVAVALPSVATAGNCRNVDITIMNHTGGEIKIKKIWHYDYQTTYTKDLQYVKGEKTKVKVQYYQYDQ